MAALPAIAITLPSDEPLNGQPASIEQLKQILEVSGIFQGHALTRKEGRLTSGLGPIDALIGGIARGRISEVTGPISSGKTTIAAAFASAASRRGEVIGWVDVPGAFDPRSLEAAGADLARILWLSFAKKPTPARSASINSSHSTFITKERERRIELKAAEMLLEAGGFGLVVIDFGAMRYPLSQSASLRLARAAERSGTAVLALAADRVCGTFAALTLAMSRRRASFSRLGANSPTLFDGLHLEASVERNKLGLFGDRAPLFAAIDSLSIESSSLLPFPKGKGPGVRFAASTDLTRRSSATLSLKGEGQNKASDPSGFFRFPFPQSCHPSLYSSPSDGEGTALRRGEAGKG